MDEHHPDSHHHDDPPDHAGPGHRHGYGHRHGVIDPTIARTRRGMWALKWSFFGLLATALLQLVVVVLSGSVALFADTLHNLADAATALPLAIAFAFARLKSSRRFPYGYGRVEDLAGVLIVITILTTALIGGYESLLRLLRPQPVGHLWAVAVASVVGCLGNEAVALFRVKVGREIGSAALVADGYHARADGLTSLAVLVGATGVWLGYPLADPIVGLLITVVILRLVWQSAHAVLTRMLDGVDPDVLNAAEYAAQHVPGVHAVAEVRARWIGHRLILELNVAVSPDVTVTEGHEVAKEVRHQVLHRVPHVSGVTVHVDPATESGETFHHIGSHAHDGLPLHSHS
jgi:cation diffusion facilitator family transporter